MRRNDYPSKRFLCLACVLTLVFFTTGVFASPAKPADQKPMLQQVMKVQVPFVANEGQVSDKTVKFYTRTFGGNFYVRDNGEMVYLVSSQPERKDQKDLRKPDCFREVKTAFIKEMLVDAKKTFVEARDPALTKVNSFVGNDRNKWKTNIATYGSVSLGEVYEGITLSLKAYGNTVEKIFTVSPGADPKSIRLAMAGGRELKVGEKGELVIFTDLGPMIFSKPVAYQEIDNTKVDVAVAYRAEKDIYSFQLGHYDDRYPLIIDPYYLAVSTYLGGSNSDYGEDIAVDLSGNIFIAGYTRSIDFPNKDALQTLHGGGDYDAFVAKIDPNKTGQDQLVYSTYLGGIANDIAHGIAVDAGGNAYVTGFTSSNHFPTTTGGYQTAYGGGSSDAFVAKLSGNGSLLYSTYLGLSYGDQGDDIAVDSAGCAYVAGSSSGEALIAKLSANGAQLLYQTYLGGMDRDEAHGIALDTSGNIYVVGTTYSVDFPTKNAFQPSLGGTPHSGCPPNCPYSDAFVAKIDPAQAYQNQIVYATYLGGSAHDVGWSIAVDSNGNAYVTGGGESRDFPTTPGAFKTTGGSIIGEGFVTKLSADGSQLVYSTYLGGPGSDEGHGIAVDASGIAYVTGWTASNNFPTTSDALKTSNMDFSFLAFFTKLSADGSTLLYSTCLGGNISGNIGHGIAVDAADNVYVAGETEANDFPARLDSFQPHFSGGAYTREAFIVKLSPGEPDRTPPNILMIHPQENQAGVDVTSAPLTIRILITDNGPNDTGVYWNPDDPQWSIILQSGNFLIDPDKFSYDKATGMLTYVDDDGYFPAGQCHTGYVEARDMMKNVAVKWFYFNTADPDDPNSAGNDVYLCPHPDWSAPPEPMMKLAAAAGSGSRPSCPPDTDGDGLIDTTETAATHTTTTRGTLYIKPTLKNGSSLSYWADFKQNHWAAVSVPFNKLGIELVVVGDPSAPAGSNYCSPNYTCLSNWEYDPYLDPTPPPISFVEVIYDITPQPLDSTQAPIQTHTNFNGTARTWYWGLLGMTPYEATTNTNKDRYGYFRTFVYEAPLNNYLRERQYAILEVGAEKRNPEINDTYYSPMNKDKNDTVEVYSSGGYVYDPNGMITAVSTATPAAFSFNQVLQRVIAHEIVHTLLNASGGDHCQELTCLMYGAIVDWRMNDIGPATKRCTHTPGKTYDIRPRVKNALNPTYVP